MFFRVKQSGPRQYLQIVENFRQEGRVRQRVLTTLGRLDELRRSGELKPPDAVTRASSRRMCGTSSGFQCSATWALWIASPGVLRLSEQIGPRGVRIAA